MNSSRGRRAFRLSAITLPVAVLLGLQLLTSSAASPAVTFLPVYLSERGGSAVIISLVVLAGRVLGLAAALVGGALYARLSRRSVIVLGQVGYFAGILVFLTPTAWLAALLWGVSGFGMMLFSIGSQSTLMDLAQPRSLGVLTALYYWGYTLGGSLSNPAAALLLDRGGYPRMVLGLGALAVAAVLLAAGFLPGARSPRPDRPPAPAHSLIGLLGPGGAARRPELLLLGLLRFLPTFLYGLTLVFVPLLLKGAGASRGTIALFAAISSIGAALCQLIIGRLADTRGSRGPTLLAFALLAAGAAALAAGFSSPGAVFAGGTAVIVAAWALSTLLPVQLARVAEPADYGQALAVMQLFWNMAMIASSLAGGFLFEAGRGLPFVVGGALNLLALALVPLFFRLPVRR